MNVEAEQRSQTLILTLSMIKSQELHAKLCQHLSDSYEKCVFFLHIAEEYLTKYY